MKVPEPDVPDVIVVTSPAVRDGERIPTEYTCQGAAQVPELSWRSVPASARSLALVVSDPDAPRGTFLHWILYDLGPGDGGIAGGGAPASAREAENSAGKSGWSAPCPPSGTHRYRFTVYALRERASGESTQQVLDAVERAAVARGTLTGVVQGG
jgi:Raf kinase inhibitor-like YbhB/YbcL family protein